MGIVTDLETTYGSLMLKVHDARPLTTDEAGLTNYATNSIIKKLLLIPYIINTSNIIKYGWLSYVKDVCVCRRVLPQKTDSYDMRGKTLFVQIHRFVPGS